MDIFSLHSCIQLIQVNFAEHVSGFHSNEASETLSKRQQDATTHVSGFDGEVMLLTDDAGNYPR